MFARTSKNPLTKINEVKIMTNKEIRVDGITFTTKEIRQLINTLIAYEQTIKEKTIFKKEVLAWYTH